MLWFTGLSFGLVLLMGCAVILAVTAVIALYLIPYYWWLAGPAGQKRPELQRLNPISDCKNAWRWYRARLTKTAF